MIIDSFDKRPNTWRCSKYFPDQGEIDPVVRDRVVGCVHQLNREVDARRRGIGPVGRHDVLLAENRSVSVDQQACAFAEFLRVLVEQALQPATASSALPVTFHATGNCTVSGTKVHIAGAGSCTLTASQAGDGNYNPAPDLQHAIVIANHPTLIDITALTVAVGPACIVAKKALFSNPFVGPLLRACGHIAVGFPGDGTESAVDQAEARLRAGHLVILFPEGTRSPVGDLGRFRLGAFELARRTGLPILPVRISVEPPALWKGLPWYAIPRQTVDFRLQALPTVSIDPSATMAELRDITATMKATLAARAEATEG